MDAGIPVNHTDEEILFRSDRVVVTDKRVLLKTKSYAASAIASVRVRKREQTTRRRPANPARAFGLFAGGFLLLAGLAFAGLSAFLARTSPPLLFVLTPLGLLAAVFGLLMLLTVRKRRPGPALHSYAVVIRTVDGQEDKIRDLSKAAASAIADAISAASARR